MNNEQTCKACKQKYDAQTIDYCRCCLQITLREIDKIMDVIKDSKKTLFIRAFKQFSWVMLFYLPCVLVVRSYLGNDAMVAFMLGYLLFPVVTFLSEYMNEKF